MIRDLLLRLALLFVAGFVLPCALSSAWWAMRERPASWRAASWEASGLLPAPDGAAIHVLAARTGGWKGAVSAHSWIVYAREDDTRWTRWDVVGWGAPVRRDAYPPDGRWYSNAPWIVGSVTGAGAARLIPEIEAAIATYPDAGRGSYRIWPGPNSNSFVARILRDVPGLGMTLPPIAVGKDWLGTGARATLDDGWNMHVSAWGLAGLALGPRVGVELQLVGQTLGLDLARPALKLPGIGRVGLPQA